MSAGLFAGLFAALVFLVVIVVMAIIATKLIVTNFGDWGPDSRGWTDRNGQKLHRNIEGKPYQTWEYLYGHPFPEPLYIDSFQYAYDCAAKLRKEGDEVSARKCEDAVKPFRAFGRDN